VAKGAKNIDPDYPAKRAAFERLAATIPNIKCKGDANPYTAVNGNMFSYLHPSGSMALRLPADEREAFLREHETTLFQAYGIVQREYVTVPDDLLADTPRLQSYFELSYSYVSALKPKPSK
jgi:hypothetical protein